MVDLKGMPHTAQMYFLAFIEALRMDLRNGILEFSKELKLLKEDLPKILVACAWFDAELFTLYCAEQNNSQVLYWLHHLLFGDKQNVAY